MTEGFKTGRGGGGGGGGGGLEEDMFTDRVFGRLDDDAEPFHQVNSIEDVLHTVEHKGNFVCGSVNTRGQTLGRGSEERKQ